MPLATRTLLRALAPEAHAGLLKGSVGHAHLTAMAGILLSRAGDGAEDKRLAATAAELARDMLQAAWEEDPLNGATARQLALLEQRRPGLEPEVAEAVRAVAEAWRPPDDLRYFQRIASRRQYAKVASFIDARLAREPDNLFWLQRAMIHAAVLQDPDYALSRLHGLSGPLAFAAAAAEADFAHQAGRHARAVELYGRALEDMPLPVLAERRAHCLRAAGDAGAALAVWQDLVRRRPWHVNLVLRLHDALAGLDRAAAPLPGRVAVCLYSFNKAELLDATLASLLASDLDGAADETVVVVLDNGSADDTAGVLSAWRDRAGERLRVVALPVNVGAASARNWLMHAPETADADFLAYLDDDTELPPDWLGRLGAAVAAQPGAGVWGCKVADHASPLTLQHADQHIAWPAPDAEAAPERVLGRRFTVTTLHAEVLDFGHFDFLRPCASVTGCCHLFRADDLRAQGDFDLRFSPSQFDDLAHDMRLAGQGRTAVYQGHLRVLHKKVSGKGSHGDAAMHGNAMGNMYKLQAMYSDKELAGMAAREHRLLDDDYLAKAALVAEAVGPAD